MFLLRKVQPPYQNDDLESLVQQIGVSCGGAGEVVGVVEEATMKIL